MCRKLIVGAAILGFSAGGAGGALGIPHEDGQPPLQDKRVQMAQGARTCRAVSSCREAVILWCGGYRRADTDDDGIPCENVCRSLAQVEAIKKEIDC
jgi:hypothetical protein